MNQWITEPSFTLDESFCKLYEKKEPNFGPIGRTVFYRTYVRRKENGKIESVFDVFRRVVEGHWSILKNHCLYYKRPWNAQQSQRSAQKAFEVFWHFQGLSSGRALWTMGTPFLSKAGGSALNNCAFTSTKGDLSKALAFMMDQSMLGVGVAFDLEGAGSFYSKRVEGICTTPWVIDDSREGWVESIKELVNAYTKTQSLQKFDYSKIRKIGSPIKGFGGTSSGPEPLIKLHKDMINIFKGAEGRTLGSVEISDLMNRIGQCVVAGNVRRTAQLCLGHASDSEYMNRKNDRSTVTGKDSWRWASNDSFYGEIGMDYSFAPQRLNEIGDLGFMWMHNARNYGRMVDGFNGRDSKLVGCNPCGEIGLEDKELCNLVELYPARHKSLDDIYSTAKVLYLCAKAVSLVESNWEETNEVVNRNHRIGFSLSGLMRSYAIHGIRSTMEACDSLYTFISGVDEQYSKWLSVPTSIKRTTIQPSGTKSLLLGESPGIHPVFAPYYIRRVEYQENDTALEAFEVQGFRMTHRSEKKTYVVEFPIAETPGIPTYKDSNLWTQMIRASEFQKVWADNQISCTVVVKEHEIEQLPEALTYFETSLKSISFLKEQHDFVNPPYEEISEGQYKELHNELHKKKIKFEGTGEAGCNTDKCTLLSED